MSQSNAAPTALNQPIQRHYENEWEVEFTSTVTKAKEPMTIIMNHQLRMI